MTSADIQREILLSLRHGELSTNELADAIDQAPFRVRAELQALSRVNALVQDTTGQIWRLTRAGERWAWQMQEREELWTR